MLIGPSISTIQRKSEQARQTGFIDKFKDRLYALSIEEYVIFSFSKRRLFYFIDAVIRLLLEQLRIFDGRDT